MLLFGQKYVSPQRPMPVSEKSISATISSQSAETVTLSYFSGSTLTTDAGQAAGTVVVGQLAYNNVLNALGSMLATKADTSLSFTSTALTTEVAINREEMEDGDAKSLSDRLTALTSTFANGEYCVDYAAGVIYGKKASTQFTLTAAAYKVKQGATSGNATTNLTQWGGTSTTLGQKTAAASVPVVLASDTGTLTTSGAVTSVVPGVGASNLGKNEDAVHTSGDVGVMTLAVRRDTAATSAGADGDYATVNEDANGNVWASLGTQIEGEDATNRLMGMQNKPVAVSTYAFSVDKSAALEASSVTKATAGVMRLFSGRIDSTQATGTYYVQFLNAASLPADGAVTTLAAPTKIQHVTGTDTPVNVDFTMNGVYASTGIVWCLSSSEFTKTIGGAFMSGTMLYI